MASCDNAIFADFSLDFSKNRSIISHDQDVLVSLNFARIVIYICLYTNFVNYIQFGLQWLQKVRRELDKSIPV